MRLTTNALIVRKADYRDADLIIGLFTESHGTLSAIAYSARRSRRRFPILDPLHTMRVELDDDGGDLITLREASVTVPRMGYLRDMVRLTAAVMGLGWVRRVSPPRQPDAAMWGAANAFLDAALTCEAGEVQSELAAFGLTMLRIAGWSPPPSSVRSGMSAESALRVVTETMSAHAG